MTNLHLMISEPSGHFVLKDSRPAEKRKRLRRSPRSPVLEAVDLSCIEAEEVLARLWYALEEHALSTPRIDIDFISEDKVDLRISFSNIFASMIVLDALEDY